MDLGLSNACCIVTGGTRNLGLATSLALLEEGAVVVATYRSDSTSANKFALSVPAAQRQRLRVLQSDSSESASCESLCEVVQKEFGRIDVLINNAAVIKSQRISEITDTHFDSILHNTLRGTIYMTRAVFPYMKASGARVVNISTAGVQTGNPSELLYICAKGGVEAATRVFARDGATLGITVNAIAPHVITSGMGEATLKNDPRIVSRIPLGRPGRLGEFVSLVLWLSSPKCEYLTGQVIGLNGGRLMR